MLTVYNYILRQSVAVCLSLTYWCIMLKRLAILSDLVYHRISMGSASAISFHFYLTEHSGEKCAIFDQHMAISRMDTRQDMDMSNLLHIKF